MQTKNLKKKGFTLVELVIVVAVIAVLSAILIPTIGCFVEQAKETNDMATVRLLNTALVEDEAANGKSATMTDALAAMAKKGYLVDKLTPRSTGEILWDSVSNRFMLIKGDEVLYRDNSTAGGENYELWKVLDNGEALSTTYSNYLKDGYEVAGGALSISTGLDVGNNTGINAIRYENTSATAKNVIIRTNGGELTVDAHLDTVAHYGTSDKVIITAVADNSYDEYGVVNGNIEITKGHVVIASEAKVESVIATTSDVTIDVKNTTTEVKAKEGVNLEGKVDGATAKTVKYVSTIEELIAAEGEVVLNADLVGGVVFSSGKTIILDANGHSIQGEIDLLNDGNLTIKGNGYFSHTGYLIYVGSNFAGGTLTIESGTFTAGEACIANMTGANNNKSTIIINGGTFTSLDNGVFMSNGSTDKQGANWVINGGTFNCNIKTTGYVAMGMYLSNTDVAVINGGTFNVKNGVGIVCRSGKTTINSGVVINIVNDGTVVSGKAGDSKILLNVASYIVRDEKSDYPAGAPEIINNSIYTIVETKDIKAD